MDTFEDILSMIDYALNTKRKRQLVGGMLMSVALLFGGLSFTVILLKEDDDNYDGRIN